MITTKRLCIYPKDVQRITGKSDRYGRKLLKKIKDSLKKEDHQFITVEEFCSYTGLQTDTIEKYLIT
jgi:hypothetical protein